MKSSPKLAHYCPPFYSIKLQFEILTAKELIRTTILVISAIASFCDMRKKNQIDRSITLQHIKMIYPYAHRFTPSRVSHIKGLVEANNNENGLQD